MQVDGKSQQQLGTFVSSREQQGFGSYYGVHWVHLLALPICSLWNRSVQSWVGSQAFWHNLPSKVESYSSHHYRVSLSTASNPVQNSGDALGCLLGLTNPSLPGLQDPPSWCCPCIWLSSCLPSSFSESSSVFSQQSVNTCSWLDLRSLQVGNRSSTSSHPRHLAHANIQLALGE